ncbi:MAG: ComF family protein [Gemmatimonadetes bacterium]|nr:ComF family protein [Gemmatimonadota bacterium]NNF39564.1 ComF family protein [Gemmatimonadota bacterium]NNK62950.1 ComF family protein [Gemmatimonadota bacterium]
MADRMAARLRDGGGLPAGGVLVPIPTTAARRRRRGYDQSMRLARALSERLARPVASALARPGSKSSQVALPLDRRRANVHGAFEPGPEVGLVRAHSHTILVDDVLTTGATAAAAARALTTAGARRVFLVTFARTLPRSVASGPV